MEPKRRNTRNTTKNTGITNEEISVKGNGITYINFTTAEEDKIEEQSEKTKTQPELDPEIEELNSTFDDMKIEGGKRKRKPNTMLKDCIVFGTKQIEKNMDPTSDTVEKKGGVEEGKEKEEKIKENQKEKRYEGYDECKQCGEDAEEDKILKYLKCDSCLKWECNKCSGKSINDTKYLKRNEKDTFWFCEDCAKEQRNKKKILEKEQRNRKKILGKSKKIFY